MIQDIESKIIKCQQCGTEFAYFKKKGPEPKYCRVCATERSKRRAKEWREKSKTNVEMQKKEYKTEKREVIKQILETVDILLERVRYFLNDDV